MKREPYRQPLLFAWTVRPVAAAMSTVGLCRPWIPGGFRVQWRAGRLYVVGLA